MSDRVTVGTTVYNKVILKKKEFFIVQGFTFDDGNFVWKPKQDVGSGKVFYVSQGILGKKWALPDYAEPSITTALRAAGVSLSPSVPVVGTPLPRTSTPGSVQPEVNAYGGTPRPGTAHSEGRGTPATGSLRPDQRSPENPAGQSPLPPSSTTPLNRQGSFQQGTSPQPSSRRPSQSAGGQFPKFADPSTASRRESLVPDNMSRRPSQGGQLEPAQPPAPPSPPPFSVVPIDTPSPYDELRNAIPSIVLNPVLETAEEREKRRQMEAEIAAMQREEQLIQAQETERARLESEKFYTQMEQKEIQRHAERQQALQKLAYEENMNLLKLEAMYNKRLQMEQERLHAMREKDALVDMERQALENMRRREIEAISQMERDHFDLVVKEANEARLKWEATRASSDARENQDRLQQQTIKEFKSIDDHATQAQRGVDLERRTVERLVKQLEDKEKQLLEYSLAEAERERKDIAYRMKLLEDLRLEQRTQKVELERQLEALKISNERKLEDRQTAQKRIYDTKTYEERSKDVEEWERLQAIKEEKIHPHGAGRVRGHSIELDSSPSPSRMSAHMRAGYGVGEDPARLPPHPHPFLNSSLEQQLTDAQLEYVALQANVQQTHQEAARAKEGVDYVMQELYKTNTDVDTLRRELSRARDERDVILSKYHDLNNSLQWAEHQMEGKY
eukprot:PhF_6_TR40208/c0_g1_i3/m.59703